MKRLLAVFLSLALFSGAVAAKGEELLKGESRLTVAQLEKLMAVKATLEKSGLQKKDEDEDDDKDDKNGDLSAAEIAKKLDSDPRIKPILARHGLTSMDYATAFVSMFPAAMYLMFEASMDKAGAAKLLASYPKIRQDNIALMRKNMHLLQK